MKKAVSVFSFLLFAMVAFSQDISTGSQAAEINLPDLKGKKISLSSLKGKVVLIDFWASWCVPCRKTIPLLKKLYTEYQPKGFEIYGISVDNESYSWKDAVKKNGITWLQVLDATGETAGVWNVNYIPNTFLLDKTGKIVAINPTEEELQKHLQELLK
ncbi:TlpA family protein disulfide reductase [Panacibacter ginsenosidivorans]|uniref:TlpA family protein disulfide reductase n=1 Tax=Panacibacter ginsenosidivorans TaxID=1813871 RepID=A0A5B8VHZ6_9BACT|nr:TlpA disulfide reductase family protein [Panacibacter ginsenosidivorans]QEC69908.1 TlpA family protein disulfide reductase [Panacibacter ginsenosidivorans]